MSYEVSFLEEAQQDLSKLDGAVRLQVLKGIKKVSRNPLPSSQGGYGKPLGNRDGFNLTNLLKIKFRNLGIRVVYKLKKVDSVMKIIIISTRTDEQVYEETMFRREKHNL